MRSVTRHIAAALLAVLGAASVALAQDGGAPTGATSSPESAGYSCDSSKCKSPDCLCASTSPPGGSSPQDVPQFLTFTADDAIQLYTTEVMNHFLANRSNPNGCAPKMTYFTSLSYTNYSMVTDWYVAGNEIADHTMTHAGTPNTSEIYGNLRASNAFAGIPMSSLTGFRAPLSSWNGSTLQHSHDASFQYDSSMTSATLPNVSHTDAYWPYTLDNGVANNCSQQPDICQGKLKSPGLWEIPMYATFEPNSSTIHLMDPWLDGNPDTVLEWLKYTFLTHYNGNRQPFGLYSHPIHLAINYPGVTDPIATRNMSQNFLDWAQQMPNVWIVNNQQMLEWIKNPVPNSRISQVKASQCQTPNVPADEKMCNGIPQNEAGLLNPCGFKDYPWQTCYYCPVEQPTPDNPVPAPVAGNTRHTLPSDCQTAFFNPQTNECTCKSSSCSFTDNTKPIGNYSTNLGGSGSGSDSNAPASAERTAPAKQNSSSPRSLSSSIVLPVLAALGAVALGSAVVL